MYFSLNEPEFVQKLPSLQKYVTTDLFFLQAPCRLSPETRCWPAASRECAEATCWPFGCRPFPSCYWTACVIKTQNIGLKHNASRGSVWRIEQMMRARCLELPAKLLNLKLAVSGSAIRPSASMIHCRRPPSCQNKTAVLWPTVYAKFICKPNTLPVLWKIR